MSELEKIRAISFLSILTITLIVLFALQSRAFAPLSPASEALQLCATSKGALCPEPAGAAHASHGAHAKRGALIVTTRQPTPSQVRTDDATVIGEMTVVAARLPADPLADMAHRQAALHLARAR
jgi:hypothetical protein